MNELTLVVVGLDFPNSGRGGGNRRFEATLCRPGEPVTLRHEPRNPHDRNAVAVFSARDVRIGYVSAERAPLIARRLRSGDAVAIFQALHGRTAHVRVRFDGGAPTLPQPRTAPPTGANEDGRDADVENRHDADPDATDWGA